MLSLINIFSFTVKHHSLFLIMFQLVVLSNVGDFVVLQ